MQWGIVISSVKKIEGRGGSERRVLDRSNAKRRGQSVVSRTKWLFGGGVKKEE